MVRRDSLVLGARQVQPVTPDLLGGRGGEIHDGVGVYLVHVSDLQVFFGGMFLVDAQGVDPQVPEAEETSHVYRLPECCGSGPSEDLGRYELGVLGQVLVREFGHGRLTATVAGCQVFRVQGETSGRAELDLRYVLERQPADIAGFAELRPQLSHLVCRVDVEKPQR